MILPDPPGNPDDPHRLAQDEAIPMLTEIVGSHEPHEPRPHDSPDAVEADDASRIAEQVRDAVTRRLLERSRELLDRHLRDQLHAMLAAELEPLAQELAARIHDRIHARLYDGLEPVVRELITQAVLEELDRYNRGLSSPPPGP